MTPKDIQEIETTFSIALPQAYVDAICPYSFPSESSLANYAMLDSKEWLVELNQRLRTNGWNGADWPQHYFVIGYDGGECYYFLDVSQNDTKVFIISKEGCDIGDAEVYAPTLTDFIDADLEADEEIDDAVHRDDSHRESKEWWELWE